MDYHLAIFNFANNVIWSKSLSADVNSMDVLFGASTTESYQSIFYAASIVSGRMLMSRVDSISGTVQWTYGFKCSNNKKNLKMFLRQNVMSSFNVVAASCLNEANIIRFTAIKIANTEASASLAPMSNNYKIFDYPYPDAEVLGLFFS
jgi:hypothetical protein